MFDGDSSLLEMMNAVADKHLGPSTPVAPLSVSVHAAVQPPVQRVAPHLTLHGAAPVHVAMEEGLSATPDVILFNRPDHYHCGVGNIYHTVTFHPVSIFCFAVLPGQTPFL